MRWVERRDGSDEVASLEGREAQGERGMEDEGTFVGKSREHGGAGAL